MGRVFHVTSSKFSNITDGKYLICFLSHFFYMLHLKNLDMEAQTSVGIILTLVTFGCNLGS